ncbi:Energy-coupling factor transporter transmembrane protein EcfT [bioreactor metagenome]|uniref:Energy-coupling factor transporter transmembrane protein EcfT n=1 Tax=bioreactor metagenome TaxID=1076179 RepID=A0A645J8E5_9ZZZZ
MAMEARCYRGGENRTRMKELQHTGRDWAAYGFMLVFILILVYLKFTAGKL